MKRTLAFLAAAAAVAAAPSYAAAQPFPSTPPTPGPAPRVQLPQPVRQTLGNGLTVLYVTQRELPVVSAVLVARGAGTADEPVAQSGLASFTANMLDEGAGGRSALELADALEAIGASLSTSAGWDNAQANLYVLRSNFPAALRIMADVVTRPDFPERELERLRSERLTSIVRGRDEPRTIAGNAFQSLVYGPQHAYGRFATTESTQGLNRAGVAQFHGQAYRPESSTLILVGDVNPAEMRPLVEAAFGQWRAAGPAVAASTPPAEPSIDRTVIYLVDKPGSAQSEIRIGHPGVARSNPDYFPLVVMNTLLGGSFTSRLNQNLRETHGWSYGAGSSFSMLRGAGAFTAAAGVQTNATDSSLVEFFRELKRIRDESVTPEELDKAKKYLALSFPGSLETTQDVARQFATLETYGIPASFLETYVQNVMAVTAADLRRVANRYVRPDRAVVVVVGDRQTVEAGIRAANLGPVEVRELTEFVR
ncbi:MAG TPA: pitrilysin family protein [Longimicrobium sp.]|nr:pitrilysin family protein [Longimicrobium sp.]